MRQVHVSLGERSYGIAIGEGLLSQLGKRCAELGLGRKCAIITDTKVGRHYGKAALESLRSAGCDAVTIAFPAGEKSKNLKTVEFCYQELAKQRFERKSFIVALGGGVVGDLAGFVAATYLRGVPFVQIPTTLLAQVDSSVGGKVGVNLRSGKNLVGAFYQPQAVLCDLETLRTLSDREFKAGLAEVIKYGIIYDAHLFEMLEAKLPAILRRDVSALAEIVSRSCEIKAEVVGQDETESGLRAILNFGHTIGHGIEAITRYGTYLHGEAISIGQVAAAYISQRVLGCPEEDVKRIRELFVRAGLPVSVRFTAAQKRALMDAMRLDKKVSGGDIKFVLARRIGEVEFGHKAPQGLIEQALNQIQTHGRRK